MFGAKTETIGCTSCNNPSFPSRPKGTGSTSSAKVRATSTWPRRPVTSDCPLEIITNYYGGDVVISDYLSHLKPNSNWCGEIRADRDGFGSAIDH